MAGSKRGSHLMLSLERLAALPPSRGAESLDELVKKIQEETGATFLIITHNIASVMRVSDFIAVLYRAELVKFASKQEMRTTDDEIIRQFLAGRAKGPIGMDEMAQEDVDIDAHGSDDDDTQVLLAQLVETPGGELGFRFVPRNEFGVLDQAAPLVGWQLPDGFGVLRRLLELEFGPDKVKHVRNLTDVDDRTIAQTQKEKRPLAEITRKWTDKFHADCTALNCLPPHVEPTATVGKRPAGSRRSVRSSWRRANSRASRRSTSIWAFTERNSSDARGLYSSRCFHVPTSHSFTVPSQPALAIGAAGAADSSARGDAALARDRR